MDDLYNETWGYITNQKLLSKLESFVKEKVFYRHRCSHMEETFKGLNKNQNSWHRDTDSAQELKIVTLLR